MVDDQEPVFSIAENSQVMHRCPDAEREKRNAVRDEAELGRRPEPPGIGWIEAELSDWFRDPVATVEEDSRRVTSEGLPGCSHADDLAQQPIHLTPADVQCHLVEIESPPALPHRLQLISAGFGERNHRSS